MFVYIFLFMSGAILASFIHVYVSRTLRNESIVRPGSHCTNCRHRLKWYELIPIFSYLFQRGRCRKCNAKIGIDSLISEVLLGLLFVIVYWRYGLSADLLIGLVIACLLLAVFLSDFKEMIILDSSLVVSTFLIYIIVYSSLGWRGIYKSFLYGIFAFVLFFLIKILGDKIFKRESLGGGDIKLAFIIGSVLPYDLFLCALIIGSSLALPYALYISNSKKTSELPYGPFLVLGLFLVFLFKNDILDMLNMAVELERIIV